MESKALAVLAGAGVPMILAGSASAGFVGIKVVQKSEAQAFGLFVCNVYAVFDRPDDEFYKVGGTPDHPLNIFAINGHFFQHQQGVQLTAPFLQFLPGNPPTLAYDTFVTIGVKADDLFSTLDNVSTTPGLGFAQGSNQSGQPNLNNGPLSTISGSWFIFPSGPGNGGNGAPNANGQVLVGQFTIEKGSGAAGIGGTMLVGFISNGVPGVQAYVEFNHPVPAPGGLGLLGIGAALGGRRRRP